MKKMSEVFEFPVLGYELEYKISETTGEQDDAIAHAINHVDALADALDKMMDLAWMLSQDLSAEFESRPEVEKAKAALASYRGEK